MGAAAAEKKAVVRKKLPAIKSSSTPEGRSDSAAVPQGNSNLFKKAQAPHQQLPPIQGSSDAVVAAPKGKQNLLAAHLQLGRSNEAADDVKSVSSVGQRNPSSSATPATKSILPSIASRGEAEPYRPDQPPINSNDNAASNQIASVPVEGDDQQQRDTLPQLQSSDDPMTAPFASPSPARSPSPGSNFFGQRGAVPSRGNESNDGMSSCGPDTQRSRTALKDLEPFSVEYVYEKHRRRCKTTTPMGSRTGSPSRTRLPLITPRPDADLLGVLNPEERVAVHQRLLPKKIVTDAFEQEFDRRLKIVMQRNNNECLRQHQEIRDHTLAVMLANGEEKIRNHEQRLVAIEEMQRNLQAAKKEALRMSMISKWIEVTMAVNFGVRLMGELQSVKSIQTLKRTMHPMIVRKKMVLNRRWARRELTNERLEDNPKPTPSMMRIMQGHFFEGWSDRELQMLIDLAKPLSFLPGEYIMFEGDYDRVMYLITKGKVEVQIRDKKAQSKRRKREFCAATFEIPAPAYVGEFALLCKEPRSASIQCLNDVDTWVVSNKDFHSVVDHLSPAIARRQQEATDERRKANLKKYFALRPEVIRKSKYFAHWDISVLRELSAALEPLVLRPGNRLYNEGEYEPALYFIADGTIRLTKPSEASEPPVHVSVGDIIGAFETFFMQERRSHTAVCTTNCDLWKLTRQQLLDLGMSDPAALVKSKHVVQETKAAEMFKLPKAPPYVLQDPYLSFVLPPTQIQQLWQAGQARVIGAGEHLSIDGDEARHIYFVVLGSLHVTHLEKDLKKYDDKVVVSPVLGGVHSGSQYTNDNLKAMFPSCTYCEVPKVGGQGKLLRPKKSFRSGSFMMHGGHQALHASLNGGGISRQFASSSDLAASLKIAQQEGVVGVVLGAYEFATRQTRWSATYRCATMCEVFVVDRDAFEARLPEQLLHLQRTCTSNVRLMVDAYLNRNPSTLLALPQQDKIVGMYLALKQQEKNEKMANDQRKGGKKVGLLRSAVANVTTARADSVSQASAHNADDDG